MKLVELSPHFHRLDIGSTTTIWFSYETPIAFRWYSTTVARENNWGPTTGKHLNTLVPKDERIDGEAFMKRLNALSMMAHV